MHPSRDDLQRLMLGTLVEDKADSIIKHIEDCAECEQVMQELDSGSDEFLHGLKNAPADDPFEQEADCQQLVTIVKAIGREVSDSGVQSERTAAVESDLGKIGQYQLIAKLGQGGMGAVYKALHTRLRRVVALKVLPAERMQNEAALARFDREMQAVGKLNHPNIVTAHDAGDADGMHYLVMELVEGFDLSKLVKRIGPLEVSDACELIRQSAIGLQHAHERSMVHRDIKPSNLMLARTEDGAPIVKVLDMGLALLDEPHTPDGDGLTSTGQMMGTLDYMSPEQGTDTHNVDIRADIYSLGASMFKLLCGEAPFSSDEYNTPGKMFIALATKTPPSIAEKRSGLPTELVSIIDSMLAKDREDRSATPQQVAELLTPFCTSANLRALLDAASVDRDAETKIGQAVAPTHESLKSESAETAPTVDAPQSPPLPQGESPGEGSPRTEVAPTIATTQHQSSGATGSASEVPRRTEDTLAKPAPPSKAPSRLHEGHWYTNRRNQIITAAALVGIVVLGVIMIRIRTNYGWLEVEIDDAQITATMREEGLTIEDTSSGRKYTIQVPRMPEGKQGDDWSNQQRLPSGEYRVTSENLRFLVLDDNGAEIETNEFKISRNGKLRARVTHIDSVVARNHKPNASSNSKAASTHTTNYAIKFDGKSSYVEIPSLKYDGSHPLTLEAFVTPASLPGSSRTVVGNVNFAGVGIGVHRSTDWQAFWAEQSDKGDGYEYVGSHSTLLATVNERVHLAGVFNGTTVTAFVNGVAMTSARAGKHVPSRFSFFIGADPRPGPSGTIAEQLFGGLIDEVRISTIARYDKEFEPLQPDHRFETDEHTLALYHFDEGFGNVAKDATGRHDGTIVGAKYVPIEPVSDSNERVEQLAAKWALEVGGTIGVVTGEDKFEIVAAMPTEPFELAGIFLQANQRVTDDDLVRLKDLEYLRSVDLSSSRVSDPALPHLAAVPGLRALNLVGTQVTDEGLAKLATAKTLVQLAVSNTKVSPTGVAKLKIALPECDIKSSFTHEQVAAAMEELRKLNEAAAKWISLFDGKDIKAWKASGDGGWTVRDGVIVADAMRPDEGGSSLMTLEVFVDYELEFEFRLPDKADILPIFDKLGPSIENIEWDVALTSTDAIKVAKGTWHKIAIIERDRRLKMRLDDKQIAEHSYGGRESQGHLSLRRLDAKFEYRNIRVRKPARSE